MFSTFLRNVLRLDITQWNCQKNTKVPYFPIHVHKTLNLKAASHPKEKSSHKEAEQPYVSSFLFCAFYVHINRYTSCLVQLQWPGYTLLLFLLIVWPWHVLPPFLGTAHSTLHCFNGWMCGVLSDCLETDYVGISYV